LTTFLVFCRASYASAVLGVVILSVRSSVCLSQACFLTNPKNIPVSSVSSTLMTSDDPVVRSIDIDILIESVDISVVETEHVDCRAIS